ncbi:unnamed protein product [Spirodela intermedia]|uniref:Uncharacterized protein n=1 Tax=Spirodela intermedia TaxID=51605 RepID=A0A7I8JU15_SPIIN|nr:unnamed protein product [Spirodela intermedia]CAA6672942.1 unnamed protein product [Spirodela intermedia]
MGRQIISNGYHPAERKKGDFATLLLPDREELDGGEAREVATRLPTDRPLPDDGFRLATGDVEGEWRTRALSVPSQAARAPARGYSPTALPTRLRARLAGGSPIFAIFLFLFLVLHLSRK